MISSVRLRVARLNGAPQLRARSSRWQRHLDRLRTAPAHSVPVEVHKTVARPEKMSLRHVPFERELIKQRVSLNLAVSHDRLHPGLNDKSESATKNPRNP
jgi:hypothetical protein